MDDGSQRDRDGADGWVDPHAPTEFGMDAVTGPVDGMHPGPQTPTAQSGGHYDPRTVPQQPMSNLGPPAHSQPKPDTIENGKAFAMVSHGSVLLGIPLFIIPMMQRDNSFALHHGKAAAVNFIFFLVALGVTFVTCGLAFPLIFLVYIPMIVGCVNAANGERASGWAWGGAGEKMFPGLQVKDTQLLE